MRRMDVCVSLDEGIPRETNIIGMRGDGQRTTFSNSINTFRNTFYMLETVHLAQGIGRNK